MAGKGDYLLEAKNSWDLADVDGTKHEAQLAIGAALIAIAEELQKSNARAERDWFAENEETTEEIRVDDPIDWVERPDSMR